MKRTVIVPVVVSVFLLGLSQAGCGAKAPSEPVNPLGGPINTGGKPDVNKSQGSVNTGGEVNTGGKPDVSKSHGSVNAGGPVNTGGKPDVDKSIQNLPGKDGGK